MPDENRVSKKVLLLLMALGVLLVVVLMFALRELALQVIVTPILYILWLVDFLLESIPQPFFWVILILVMLRIAFRSLVTPRATLHRPQLSPFSSPQGRVTVWRRRLELAREGNYSRWGVARHITSLMIDMLVHRDQITLAQARERLRKGDLDAPSEVRAYIQAGMMSQPPNTLSFFARLMQHLRLQREQTVPALNLDLEQLVDYMEDQLEVIHDIKDH